MPGTVIGLAYVFYFNRASLPLPFTSATLFNPLHIVYGTAAIVQAVTKDKNGIGYGGAAYGGSCKLLGIKKTDTAPAISPTEENVVSGAYPIWRHLYVYVNPALDKGQIAAYLSWIRSDEGQKYVKDIGYYPLPKNLRSN